MRAAETIRGQLAAAEGLVRYQLRGSSPNARFASVVPHVGSTLEALVRAKLMRNS